MTFNELNKKIKKELQKKRPADKPYKKYLQGIFKMYRDSLAKLDQQTIERNLPIGINFGVVQKQVLSATTALLKAYNAYSEGKISTAIKTMKNKFLVQGAERNSFRLLSLDSSSSWYRGRILGKEDRSFNRKDMFHIPFEKRTVVENYRYSISGYPCLYLGNTILSCWVEMNMPTLDDFAVSGYKIQQNETIKVLDLRLPSSITQTDLLLNEPSDEDIRMRNLDLLMTWPLIIACSIRSITPDANFKYEYVHPQILMLALKENTDFWGVVYTSTRMMEDLSNNEDDYCNVAIPVRKVASKGQCKDLSDKFKLTRGVSMMEMEIKHKLIPLLNVEGIYNVQKDKFRLAEDYIMTTTLDNVSNP